MRNISNTYKKLLAGVLFALLFCLLPSAASAQLTIAASVDKDTIRLDETLTLAVTITGATADVGDPQLPSIPNFNVYSSGQSQNIMIINGRISSSIKYQFNLMPRFVGNAKIGPITLHYHNADYSTKEIAVKILPPAAQGNSSQSSATQVQSQQQPHHGRQQAGTPAPQQPQPQRKGAKPSGKDVFVVAKVDKKSAYVNEQVNLSVKFYTSVSLMGNPDYVAPEAKSFLSEDLPPLRNGEETIDGRNYYFTEIKTAFFGAAPGTASVGSALVRYQVRQDVDMDPFDPNFFQSFFANGLANAVTRETKTDPLAITINPLPEEGKPASFTGAVGNFHIMSSLDRKELKTGEAASLAVTVEGVGNIKAITAPAMPDLPALKIYDVVSSLNIKKDHDVVQGSKTFKAVLIPKTAGKITIPPLVFSFFNPETGKYATISSVPIELTVQQGEASAQQVSFTPGPAAEVTALTEDIHYIRENGDAGSFTKLLGKIAAGGLENLAALLLCALAFGFTKFSDLRNSDVALLRYRKAYSAAKNRIREAENMFAKNQHGAAMSLLSDTLSDYLCDKLSCPIGGMTLKKIIETAKTTYPALQPSTVERLGSIWEELDLLRFAPAAQVTMSAGSKPISVRLMELIDILEKEMKK